MGLFNSEILTANDGFIVVDIDRQWKIDLARCQQNPTLGGAAHVGFYKSGVQFKLFLVKGIFFPVHKMNRI